MGRRTKTGRLENERRENDAEYLEELAELVPQEFGEMLLQVAKGVDMDFGLMDDITNFITDKAIPEIHDKEHVEAIKDSMENLERAKGAFADEMEEQRRKSGG